MGAGREVMKKMRKRVSVVLFLCELLSVIHKMLSISTDTIKCTISYPNMSYHNV